MTVESSLEGEVPQIVNVRFLSEKRNRFSLGVFAKRVGETLKVAGDNIATKVKEGLADKNTHSLHIGQKSRRI